MRRLLVLGVTFGLLLALAPSASAVTLERPDGSTPQPLQRWADRSRVGTPPGAVTVVEGPCPMGSEYVGCTSRGGPLYIDLLPMDDPTDTDWIDFQRQQFLHELGHQFDYQAMTPGARNRFRRFIHDRRPWRTSDKDSPHEIFAEVYAICAMPKRGERERVDGDDTDYANRVRSFKKHRAVCRMLKRVAKRATTSARKANWADR